jgi:hypothetical protein
MTHKTVGTVMLALVGGLACTLAACTLQSLDYLSKGTDRDASPKPADASGPPPQEVAKHDDADGPDLAAARDAAPDLPGKDIATLKLSALFVVGTIPITSADALIESRLVADGFTVKLLEDKKAASFGTVGESLVLISRTATSADVRAAFRSTPKPVMVWEALLYPDMGMVDGNAWGTFGYLTIPGFTTLVVNSAAGELAAGLSGTITVLGRPDEMDYGVPSPQAITVAALPGEPDLWSIFAYETGAQMFGLTAPARRVGFFFSETAPANLTADGWRLFDAAVSWLVK